jgi:hypothetical protein
MSVGAVVASFNISKYLIPADRNRYIDNMFKAYTGCFRRNRKCFRWWW